MKLKLGKKNKVEVDKIFVNKIIKKAPLQLWFNNLSFSDFIFLDKMNEDMLDVYGTIGFKKNLLFYNDNFELTLYCGCFISVLEKDRCSIKCDKTYKLEWNKYKNVLDKHIKSEIRKEKISLLLNEY